jgi:hypothetical protein
MGISSFFKAPQTTFDSHNPHVTSVLPDGDVPNFDGLSADEAALVALGYKQEFKREFSLWTTFCVSFAVLGLLPSFASTLYYGMGYAGTGGMVWGWLIAWFFIQCVACSMAELCSSMPTRYVSARLLRTVAVDLWKCTDRGIVVDSTMHPPCLRLQDGVHWLHGSLGGRTGSVKSPERRLSTMARQRWCLLPPPSQIRIIHHSHIIRSFSPFS